MPAKRRSINGVAFAKCGKISTMKVVPWPLDVLPRVRVAGRFPHSDRHHERTYRGASLALHLYEYRCAMRMGERSMELGPGDVTVSPPNVATSYHVPEPGFHLCIHVGQARVRRGVSRLELPTHLRLGPRRDFVAQRFMTVVRWHATAQQDRAAAAAASGAMLELLVYLSRLSDGPARRGPRPADKAVEQAADLIEQRLSQPLCVPALAREVSLSQNYLARCFRGRFGMTIPAYLLRRRIQAAGHLLTTTDRPIKQIAAAVGLPDAHHFNKQFRRLTGVSPSACRAAGLLPVSDSPGV